MYSPTYCCAGVLSCRKTPPSGCILFLFHYWCCCSSGQRWTDYSNSLWMEISGWRLRDIMTHLNHYLNSCESFMQKYSYGNILEFNWQKRGGNFVQSTHTYPIHHQLKFKELQVLGCGNCQMFNIKWIDPNTENKHPKNYNSINQS